MSRFGLAVSTCWNSSRHVDGYAMLKELASLGFKWVELSHGVKITLVEGILRAVDEGVIQVASCHNFCPLPPGITTAAPNLYMPSSPDQRERAQWARHTRKSIDFAAQVGARLLVLHLGRVEFFWFNPSKKLEKTAGKRGRAELLADPTYREVLAKSLAKLQAKAPEYWAHVKTSLQEMLPYAKERGIKLCLENRERFDELPIDAQFGELLDGFAADSEWIGYWHDTGHATLKHEAGIIDHADQLRSHAARQFGFHLHDVSVDGRDHQPIGTGVVDWEVVKAAIRPEHQLVVELSPRVKPEDVLASRKFVDSWFS